MRPDTVGSGHTVRSAYLCLCKTEIHSVNKPEAAACVEFIIT